MELHLLLCIVPLTWQIFTKPVSDRPTIFIEIIERRGCYKETRPNAADNTAYLSTSTGGDVTDSDLSDVAMEHVRDIVAVRENGLVVEQAAGCGGFGKGNISELFKVLSVVTYIGKSVSEQSMLVAGTRCNLLGGVV